MKRKDLLIIGGVILVSAILSSILSSVIITAPKNRQTKVELVEKINPTFPTPDPRYLNVSSVDPTQVITIGNNNNSNPFNSQK